MSLDTGRTFPWHVAFTPTLLYVCTLIATHRGSQLVLLMFGKRATISSTKRKNEVSRPSARESNVLPTLGTFSPMMSFSSLVKISLQSQYEVRRVRCDRRVRRDQRTATTITSRSSTGSVGRRTVERNPASLGPERSLYKSLGRGRIVRGSIPDNDSPFHSMCYQVPCVISIPK